MTYNLKDKIKSFIRRNRNTENEQALNKYEITQREIDKDIKDNIKKVEDVDIRSIDVSNIIEIDSYDEKAIIDELPLRIIVNNTNYRLYIRKYGNQSYISYINNLINDPNNKSSELVTVKYNSNYPKGAIDVMKNILAEKNAIVLNEDFIDKIKDNIESEKVELKLIE